MRKVQLTLFGKILINAIIALCATVIAYKYGFGFLGTIGISLLCQIPLMFGDKIIKLVSSVKMYFTKRKASKHYLTLIDARRKIEINLVRITNLMEYNVNSPALSEEEKIKIVDKFLERKDKLENTLNQLNTIIQHYRYFREVEYGQMNLVSLIHDTLEDMTESVNYNIQQFENEHLGELISSVNSKSHTLDVMNESEV